LETWLNIENIAVLFAVLYLILAAYEYKICWIAGGISTFLYILICYQAGLFVETGLQVFYLIMAFVGYYQWSNSLAKHTSNKINSLSKKMLYKGLFFCSIISLLVAYIFDNYTTAQLPWLDAPVTIFSIWATWLVIKKTIENWLFWIVIDATCVYIYYSRNLETTALLYILYTILAVIGYFKWKKKQHTLIELQ
jgi:nicotinamide mononucleotide transporter